MKDESKVIIDVISDQKIILQHGWTEMGQGVHNMALQTLCEETGIDPEIIDQVEVAILSTKTPQNPKDQISRILCDADLMNLTFDDYFEQIDLMRKEWEKVGKAKLNSHEFHISSLKFFQSHEYHSKYGKKVLQPKKEQTEEKIRNKVYIDK